MEDQKHKYGSQTKNWEARNNQKTKNLLRVILGVTFLLPYLLTFGSSARGCGGDAKQEEEGERKREEEGTRTS